MSEIFGRHTEDLWLDYTERSNLPNPMLLLLPSLFLAIGISLPLSSSLSLSSSPSPSSAAQSNYRYEPKMKNYDMHITSLHRYAVKGLSGDSIDSVIIQEGDGTFGDDRRFALLYHDRTGSFRAGRPEWLHKDNFLCAFTAPELLATLRTEYKVDLNGERRLLTVWTRNEDETDNSTPLLSADLASSVGRDATSTFFSELCGKKVVCVCASDVNKSNNDSKSTHTHQFGNTSSGVKNNSGDTRTIHIVNSNTVKQFSDAIQHDLKQQQKQHEGNGIIQLNPTRFRPNVIVDGLDPWSEFDLIGKTIEVIPKESDQKHQTQQQAKLRFRITSRTVRCAGIGVDPLQPELGRIDIPKLLIKHFPQHGPYLGVYAVVDQVCGFNCGQLCVGDTFRVVEE